MVLLSFESHWMYSVHGRTFSSAMAGEYANMCKIKLDFRGPGVLKKDQKKIFAT